VVVSLLTAIGNNVQKNFFVTFDSIITTDRQWRVPLYFQFTIRVHGNFIHNRALPISKLWYRLGRPNKEDVTIFEFLQNYVRAKLNSSLPRYLVLDHWGVQNVWGHVVLQMLSVKSILLPSFLGIVSCFISIYVALKFNIRNEIYVTE
jgi:hypothetical protein